MRIPRASFGNVVAGSYFLVLAIFVVSLAVAGCSHKAGGGEGEGKDKDKAETAVAEVTITRVTRADVSQTLILTGTISALPNQDVRVSSQVAGRLAQVKVAEGDSVAAGQLLAQIDERPVLDQLRQAEAGVAQAQANLDNAKLTRARNENLYERGIAARKEVEDARTQESVATATLNQAQAALALARLQVTRTQVRSPLTGMVVKRFVNVGEQVDGTAGQPVAEVANLNQVELFGNVPSAYLS